KRKESEPTVDVTEEYVSLEEVVEEVDEEEEEDRSPKPKKKKKDSNNTSVIKAKSPKQTKPRLEDEEVDKWTIEAYLSYTELESSVENKDIKEIIKCIDIEEMEKKKCQKTRKNIEDYLTTFRQEEKEKIIYETIEYINEEGQPENLKRKTYEGQIMGLIVALRNLMPKWCTGCEDWYCVKKR
ncbi:unnamed protein product, partial [Meganyctiphanes norvegica]